MSTPGSVATVTVIENPVASPGPGNNNPAISLSTFTRVFTMTSRSSEWAAGVAGSAKLCSLSDLRGPRAQWKAVLEENKDKELILYCASGGRSGVAAATLRKEGYNAVNAGGYTGWSAAGLPVRQP
jgi:rhodanese-related sulfurtransferase